MRAMARLPNIVRQVLSWLAEPMPETRRQPTFLEQMAQRESPDREKRVSSRKPLQLDAEVGDDLNGLPVTVVVENFSKHGLYFNSACRFGIGSNLEMNLELPAEIDGEARCVNLLVRIVRVDAAADGGFGIAARITRCRTLQGRPVARGSVT
jgi:hypothetical protein